MEPDYELTDDHAASHLTDKQRLAVDCIVQGLTDHEVAKEIGTARETVCRWRKNNPAFIFKAGGRIRCGVSASKMRRRGFGVRGLILRPAPLTIRRSLRYI